MESYLNWLRNTGSLYKFAAYHWNPTYMCCVPLESHHPPTHHPPKPQNYPPPKPRIVCCWCCWCCCCTLREKGKPVLPAITRSYWFCRLQIHLSAPMTWQHFNKQLAKLMRGGLCRRLFVFHCPNLRTSNSTNPPVYRHGVLTADRPAD